jgi:hypothetical protein
MHAWAKEALLEIKELVYSNINKICDDIVKHGSKIDEQIQNQENWNIPHVEPEYQELFNYFSRALDTVFKNQISGNREQLSEFVKTAKQETLHYIDLDWYDILIEIYSRKNIDPVDGNALEYHKQQDEYRIQNGNFFVEYIYELIYIIIYTKKENKILENWEKIHKHSWDLRNLWKVYIRNNCHILKKKTDNIIFCKITDHELPPISINLGGWGNNLIITPMNEKLEPFKLNHFIPKNVYNLDSLINHEVEQAIRETLCFRKDGKNISRHSFIFNQKLLDRAIWNAFDFNFIRKPEHNHKMKEDFLKKNYS